MGAFLVNPMMPVSVYLPFLLFANLVMMFSFQVFGLHRLKPGFHWIDDVIDIGKAAFVGSILLMATTFLAHQIIYSRILVVLYLPALIAVSVGLRSMIRGIYGSLRRGGFDLRRILIAGSGKNALDLARIISSRPELGYEFVGFVPDGSSSPGTRKACELSSLAECVSQEMIGEVVVALDGSDPAFTSSVLEKCRTAGVSVSVVTDHPGDGWGKVHPGTFLGYPTLSYESEPNLRVRLMLKRAADMLGSIVLLALGSPLWVILITLGLFQTGKLPFETLDSRDAEGLTTRMFSLAGGGSTGFWGRIVARFGLFPALVNVLVGGMSLVGSDPRERTTGRPGITGLWKMGGGGEGLGVLYSKEWSLSGDLKIVLMTSTRLFSLNR
jgi:putative colanic acid biosynthesis UDP-glucose lipid carrier transferase